jgi:hypothetical protein
MPGLRYDVSVELGQPRMTLILTQFATVAAGLALFATWFSISRKGLLKGLVPAVALAVTAALLITVARSFG